MPNTYAYKGVFNPIFPPNSAEGLHFSAFRYTCNRIYCYNYNYLNLIINNLTPII